MANYESLFAKSVEITKEFTFDSAHKLDKSDGKCARLHGHTYRLFVSVVNCGEKKIDRDGFVIEFNKLKQIVNSVLDKIDHKTLIEGNSVNFADFSNLGENVLYLYFKPTVENLACWIFDEINKKLPAGKKVAKIILYETPTSFVTVTE